MKLCRPLLLMGLSFIIFCRIGGLEAAQVEVLNQSFSNANNQTFYFVEFQSFLTPQETAQLVTKLKADPSYLQKQETAPEVRKYTFKGRDLTLPVVKKFQVVVPIQGGSNTQGLGSMPESLGYVRLYRAEGNQEDRSAFTRGQRIAVCRDAQSQGSLSLPSQSKVTVTINHSSELPEPTCVFSVAAN